MNAGTAPTIMVVEDNEPSRDALSRRLERRGYRILTAVDGQQAVSTAQAERPDLILMDLSLPDIDGCEATRRIRADTATASIPVIALTAHAMATDRLRAIEAGCQDYDTKPVDLARLLAKIDALLPSHD